MHRLNEYAKDRTLTFRFLSSYHFRLSDDGYTMIDLWVTGRYYILKTDYLSMMGHGSMERNQEKGLFSRQQIDGLEAWLDKLFFPELEAK